MQKFFSKAIWLAKLATRERGVSRLHRLNGLQLFAVSLLLLVSSPSFGSSQMEMCLIKAI